MLNSLSKTVLKSFVVASLGALSLTGCVGDPPAGNGNGNGNQTDIDAGPELTPEERVRQQFDDDIAPLLTQNCSGCHMASGTGGAFMEYDGAADMYESVMTYPNLINLPSPSASTLINKGAHSGPAFTPEQLTTIRDWIDEEVSIAPEDEIPPELETQPLALVPGNNTIALDGIGLTGASITMNVAALSTGLYITNLNLNAGVEGVHIVHPTFISWDEENPNTDNQDRFASVDIFAPPNGSTFIGGGTLIMVGITPTNPISVRFAVAEHAEEGTVVESGCQEVQSFMDNARGPLAQSCASAGCHGGGGAAGNAVDMSQMNNVNDPEAMGQACGQILSRVNLQNLTNSSIIQAPNPGLNLGHPFTFGGNAGNFNTFANALNIWMTAEAAAANSN